MPDVLLTFNELCAGDIVNDQYSASGVTISSGTSGKPPMVFDTSCPTGGDYDLATSNMGNVLIISEDGDSHDPDDNAHGGKLIFEFDEPTEVVNFRVLDMEEGGQVCLWDADGNLMVVLPMPKTADNGQAVMDINYDDVVKMEVRLYGSGAIDDICFRTPEPAGDGTVDGTDGDDIMVVGYVDGDGDTIDGADGDDDVILGKGGDDTIVGGDGDDTIFGGDGEDSIDGAGGNDVLFGGSAAGSGATASFNYDAEDEFGAGSTNLTDPSTGISVTVTATYDGGWGVDTYNGDIAVYNASTTNEDTATFEFSTPVSNLTFEVFDIDQGSSWDDLVKIVALDADGNVLPVTVTNTFGHVVTSDATGTTIDSTTNSSSGVETVGADDTVTITIDGPVASVSVIHDNGPTNSTSGVVGVDNFYFDVIDNGSGDDNSADILNGGDGDDELYGGGGDDELYGGDGNDLADGGDGDDVIDTSGPNSFGTDAAPDQGLDIPSPYDLIVPDVAPDANPNDDVDTVYGGAGNDSISTGDDRDTIEGGTGNDTIDSGIDDDSIDGGDGDDVINASLGSDIVFGGDGNDTIDAGIDFLSDYAGDTIGVPFADPNPNDGKDTVFGGAGDDTITAGDDADELYGGADNDSIDGGIDDDYIEGGSGDDNIEGGHGSDEIYGGDGNDIINAAESVTPEGGIGAVPDAVDPEPGNGTDLVFGGAGDDSIFGGDDDDELYGDEGSDYLEGGLDEDLLFGGANDDVILVGHGDEAYGGAGDDYFSIDPATGNLGDILIDGGETDENDGDTTKSGGDTLDLSGLYAAGAIDVGSLVITDPDPSTPGGGQTGYVFLNDGTRIDFTGIEEFICFTKGTMILTAKGEKPIEALQVGDKVVTKDHGLQELRWMGSRKMLAAGKMAPIMIKAGAMGNDRDLKVSPQHRMLIEGWKAEMLFGEPEVLAAAKHLVNGDNIFEAKGGEVEYFHILFDTHEIVYANGAASESFHPGEEGFGALAEEAREEVLTIFPELRDDVASYGAAARTSLKGHEAKILAENPDFLK